MSLSLSLVSIVCFQVEVAVSGASLAQRSPTECGVSECDREVSILRRPTRGCNAMKKKCITKNVQLTFKRRIKSHLPFAGIIRSSPYSSRFQDNG